jgi:glucose dehydrogenase
MWTTATGDEDLGHVYLPLGNSSVDYWSGSRSPAENACATALVAVDPARGVIVAIYNDMPNHNRLVSREEADRLGWAARGEERGGDLGSGAEGAGDPQAGTPYAIDVNAGWRLPVTGLLCKEPPYGGIRAIDLATG